MYVGKGGGAPGNDNFKIKIILSCIVVAITAAIVIFSFPGPGSLHALLITHCTRTSFMACSRSSDEMSELAISENASRSS